VGGGGVMCLHLSISTALQLEDLSSLLRIKFIQNKVNASRLVFISGLNFKPGGGVTCFARRGGRGDVPSRLLRRARLLTLITRTQTAPPLSSKEIKQ
jgi:hypothetical protein